MARDTWQVHVSVHDGDRCPRRTALRVAPMRAAMDYERLDAYQISLDLLSECLLLAAEVPRGFGPVGDQLRRAALSVPLNIAEGVGRREPRDRARFFTIARGSAMECGALCDVFERLPDTEPKRAHRAKELARRVVAMLTRLCAALPLP